MERRQQKSSSSTGEGSSQSQPSSPSRLSTQAQERRYIESSENWNQVGVLEILKEVQGK